MMHKIDFDKIEPLLWQVEKPARYIGGEWGEIKKNPSDVNVKIALVFPDVYEVGMSYLGQKILYELINREPGILVERVFAPWPDFEKELRRHDIPLYSLENKIPLYEFDIIGFSLTYELNYTNVLTVLDLGRVPLIRDKRRNFVDPIIIGGGPAAFNPEPLADFFDFFFVGDGEIGFIEIINTYLGLKERRLNREEILREFISIKGVYIPSFYEVSKKNKNRLTYTVPKPLVPRIIRKRQYYPFHQAPTPENFVVPHIQAVFDRASVEVARGCPQRCRFCQATSLYFPHRVKDPAFVSQKLLRCLYLSGYDEASLSALSVSDYPYLDSVLDTLIKDCKEKKIAVSLPSMRPKGLTPDIAENILQVRKTGFTLVPEAGTERLRTVINKDFKDEDIRKACRNAFSRGWQLLKLYFMIGLPTETEEDLLGIVHLIKEIVGIGHEELKRPPQINLSVSSFIPKPHTPFQWLAMENEESLKNKQSYLKKHLKKYRFIRFKFHPVKNSLLEAVFSRGDRSLSSVLMEAWKRGARFDSWADQFNYKIWEETFNDLEIEPEKYLGEIDREAKLPWDHIETGLKKSFLLSELKNSMKGIRTPSCTEQDCRECRGCNWASRMEKEFPEIKITQKTHPLFPEGKKQTKEYRYRIFYSKLKPAVYISHRDLNHNLQRMLRRAGFLPEFSKGFHPKMKITFLPALPLGMEGRQEVMEIYSSCYWEESEFLDKINYFSFPGISFFGLKQQADNKPSLQDDIKGFLYSLDVEHPLINRRLREKSAEKGGEKLGLGLTEFINDIVGYYSLNKDSRVEEIIFSPEDRKIFLNITWIQQNPLRPQDVLQEILGINNIVYAMAREKVFWLT